MRRQLNLLVLAVTLLVIVAFVGPLAVLVKRQADQRARVTAEREAQSISATLVSSINLSDAPFATVPPSVQDLPSNVSVVLSGEVIAGEVEPLRGLANLAADEGRAQSTYTERGWELALPVITRSETFVVYSVVSQAALNQGVSRAWVLLALLSLGLVIGSLIVADGLGRALVQPSQRLADAALKLGSGDLDTRVDEEDGPPEMRRVASAFNVLAGRLRDLLAAEREAMADLSHRLRTPLTAVRMEAEAIGADDERSSLIAQLDRLEKAVGDLIHEARIHPGAETEKCDIGDVVSSRVDFWNVLAKEQHRHTEFVIPSEPLFVPARQSEAAAAVDALIDNVFVHTDKGTAFQVTVSSTGGLASVIVADDGEGFSIEAGMLERGVSGGGSTGLGLDIARRLAERTGGHLTVGRSASGGARVEAAFGLFSVS